MIERVGEDMWRWLEEPNHVICITTNGCVSRRKKAVMGRGSAKEARRYILGVEELLGQKILKDGNVPGFLIPHPLLGRRVGILPVKHNWWEIADLKLIEESVSWLHDQALTDKSTVFHAPRPGCGN